MMGYSVIKTKAIIAAAAVIPSNPLIIDTPLDKSKNWKQQAIATVKY